MSNRVCVKCGRRKGLEKEVEGIRTSICCESCCRKFEIPWRNKLYGGQHRLPKKWCVTWYGCPKEDLSELNSLVLHYPVHQKKVQFYLGAEVEYLGNKTQNGWKQLLKERQGEREARVKEIVGAVKLQRMDTTLRAFLLGDYLKCPGSPSTTVDDIEARLAVLDRVKRIMKADRTAHPDAVFKFCIEHPEGKTKDFIRLKAKAQQVFRLEGERIMRFLTKTEKDALMDSPSRDIVEEFTNRDKKRMIRCLLERQMSREEAAKIVKFPACQLRIEREDDELAIAERLQLFWKYKNDKEGRRLWLEHVAREHNVGQLALLRPQKMYIEGRIDCNAEELVGLQELARNQRLWSNNRSVRTSIAVSRFEACLYYKKMNYRASIAEAVDFGRSVPLPENCRMNTFDYNVHATGFWSETWNVR